MVGTGETLDPIEFLRFSEIVEINRRMILAFGGFYTEGDKNLANPGSLAYILDAIRGSLFGYDPYPTIAHKAAALAWQIIRAHVFHDGNHRTGMEACRLMLGMNGCEMGLDDAAEIKEVAFRIDQGHISFDEFVHWLEARVVESD